MKKTEFSKGAMERKALLLGWANGNGYNTVEAAQRLPQLPVGIYPSIVFFAIAIVTVPATVDEKGKIIAPAYNRPFNSWDGFHLSANKESVEIILDEYKENAKFATPTDQVGVFFQCTTGTHEGAHIPNRFNLRGYMRREDYNDVAWQASGLEEVEGYAAKLLPDGKYERIESDAKSLKGKTMLASCLGAVFGDEKNEDGKPLNQIDLQIACEDGADLFANVVIKIDPKDPKGKTIPMFVNNYDVALCTHIVKEEVATTEAVPE